MTLLFIGFGLAIIFLVYLINKRPKSEWTEWEWNRDTIPLVTKLPNGQKVFQNCSHWNRYNKITKTWESKVVIDPIKRPFSEATSLSDLYNLRFR